MQNKNNDAFFRLFDGQFLHYIYANGNKLTMC